MLERTQFKHKLADFQALQFRFADMVTELDAARLMVHRAAVSLDTNHPEAIMHCAMAKRLATDLCFNICNQALNSTADMVISANIPSNVIFVICVYIKFLKAPMKSCGW